MADAGEGASGRAPEPTTDRSIELCHEAHRRIVATCRALTDEQARQPSRLPGWTVGHVVTHLARNAEGHTLRLEAALDGQDVPRYPGGMEQRDRDIERTAGRSADSLCADLEATIEGLEGVWRRSAAAGWPHSELLGDDRFPTTGSPLRRLREVEVHHVDLGLGYRPEDWPDEYVRWELEQALRRLPERVPGEADAARLLASLIGRAPAPGGAALEPWA